MDEWREKFRALVAEQIWLRFCNAPSRRQVKRQLVEASLEKVTDRDAEWFVRTFDSGILCEVDGDFHAPQKSAKERIFWHGPKVDMPQDVTLSIEGIVGIGAIGRLHQEHGWPPEFLGLQPKPWAFDLVAYGDNKAPILVGEVKTDPKEIDAMGDYFECKFGGDESLLKASKKNWNKKIKWLHTQDTQVVWALAPDGHERIYKIDKDAKTGRRRLRPGRRGDLDYAARTPP